jgi:hypothetical protein
MMAPQQSPHHRRRCELVVSPEDTTGEGHATKVAGDGDCVVFVFGPPPAKEISA